MGYTVLKILVKSIKCNAIELSMQAKGQAGSRQQGKYPQMLQFWTNISAKWELPNMIFITPCEWKSQCCSAW